MLWCVLAAGFLDPHPPQAANAPLSPMERGELALRSGRPQDALQHFMEALLSNPADGQARQSLHEAGKRLLQEEARQVDAERERILREAQEALLGQVRYRQAREEAEKDWAKLCEEALEASRHPKDLGGALDSYERALDNIPHFSSSVKRFAEVSEQFYVNLILGLPEFAGLPRKRLSVGELVGVSILKRKTAFSSYLVEDWKTYEGLLEKTQALRRKEGQVERLLDLIQDGESTLDKQPSFDALVAWQRVLVLDPKNWEAQAYASKLRTALQEAARESAPPPAPLAPAVVAAPPPPAVAAPPRGELTFAKRSYRRRIVRPTAAAARPSPPAPVSTAVEVPELPPPAVAPPERTEPKQGGDAETLYQKGLKAYALGRIEEAISFWEECLKAEPRHDRAGKALEHARREMAGGGL